jgi:hypothetical protein
MSPVKPPVFVGPSIIVTALCKIVFSVRNSGVFYIVED